MYYEAKIPHHQIFSESESEFNGDGDNDGGPIVIPKALKMKLYQEKSESSNKARLKIPKMDMNRVALPEKVPSKRSTLRLDTSRPPPTKADSKN